MKNICIVCGKEFESQKSTAKYCSNECRNKKRRERYAAKKEIPKNLIEKEKIKKCLICEKEFKLKNSLANQRLCCYDCMPEGTQLTRGGFLAKLKQQRGGKCIRCGYNKCLKALEFHHIDPSKKEFTISNDRFKLLDAVKESKKCVLICSNCHKELHDGMWKLSDLNK